MSARLSLVPGLAAAFALCGTPQQTADVAALRAEGRPALVTHDAHTRGPSWLA